MIEIIIVENLKKEENVLDWTLAINHKKPYTVKNYNTQKNKIHK